jgi:hypothetical protein
MKNEGLIVKIGGSCASHLPDIIAQLKECVELKAVESISIVPGGWFFADMVRATGVNDSAAHWMAVASMDIYGYYISSRDLDVVENFDFDFKGVRVLLPYRLMRTHDELPHSWDITSDSISIWLAHKIGVKEVIKLTDVDGIFIEGELVNKISADDIADRTTCVDNFSPSLMKKYGISMFVCNGLKGRVKDYILRGQAVGTLIKASRFD